MAEKANGIQNWHKKAGPYLTEQCMLLARAAPTLGGSELPSRWRCAKQLGEPRPEAVLEIPSVGQKVGLENSEKP